MPIVTIQVTHEGTMPEQEVSLIRGRRTSLQTC